MSFILRIFKLMRKRECIRMLERLIIIIETEIGKNNFDLDINKVDYEDTVRFIKETKE